MSSIQVRALKALDGLLGRAIYTSLLSSARKRGRGQTHAAAPAPQAVRRVLAIRPGGIGDAVLFFPMLGALRAAWPGASLEVLAERRNAGIFEANDRVDRVLAYDRAFGRELLTALRGRYDVVIDTEQYHYLSAVIAHFVRAPVLCGFDTRGRGGLFTHRVHYDDQTYEVFSFLDLARSVTGRECAFDAESPFFPVRAELLDEARTRWDLGRGRGIVVIQPGASMTQKCWEPEKFEALVKWIAARGWRTVLVGGKSEGAVARRIAAAAPQGSVIDLCGRIPLALTAAVVAESDLYVGSDTGVLHVAYGVGTPTVHLFGPGAIEKWAPRGRQYRAISKKLPCAPCMRYNYIPPCPYDTECMRLITVDEVVGAVAEAIGG